MAFEKIEYEFAKKTGETFGTPAAQVPVNGLFELELGDWQVTVKAYAEATDTATAATGTSATFTVGTAATANVSVKLAGNVAAGEGTFSYHIEYPEGAEITVFSLENLLVTAPLIDLTPATTSVSPYSGTEENVPAGIYWLTVQLEKDGVTTGANEAVYIYDKLDSEYSAVFSEDNFFILTYVITAGETDFTATKKGVTVGTANQPIQDVITAIRTDADGLEVTVQFGDGEDPLNIGSGSAQFNNTDGTWGLITLTGKITSENTSAGTVRIRDGVSIISVADIANTADNTNNGRAIYNDNTNTGGTVTISGGTVSAAGSGRAIYNSNTGAVNISGGTVSATTGYTVQNNSSGAVTISGGTVSATTGRAVHNNSTGTITISGGTVEATTGYAVYNSTGAVTISGGTVSATTGRAVNNNSTGTITISGGTVSASAATGCAVDKK
jgi:hypothetical protein